MANEIPNYCFGINIRCFEEKKNKISNFHSNRRVRERGERLTRRHTRSKYFFTESECSLTVVNVA